MKRLFILLLLLPVLISQAQVITVDPPFPTADVPVIVTLNTVGTSLENYDGDIYAHTGVAVDNNPWQHVVGQWGDNNTQPKLTNVGTNLYRLEITPTIRDYYGASASENITQLCFVFRSADATMQTSPDIFYDVQQEESLNLIITSPTGDQQIVELNDTIAVSWQTVLADSSFLYLNGQLLFAGTGNSFQYDLVADAYGNNMVKAVAVKGNEMVADSFFFYTRHAVTIEERPEGIKDGINYINDTTVILSLYAPGKQYVFAIGDFSDWKVSDNVYMKMTPDSSHFWVELTGLTPGKQYIYQYFIDGTIKVGDIYADQVSDPWNDQYISSSTYPDLPAYPEGKTEGIATVFRTAQQPYEWEVQDFQPPDAHNMIVYELLLRDFIDAHDFNTLIDTLDYLTRLGVNAIELMPVSEFEGNSSWGYNPNYYFAPDKYYGPKDTFKKFVDECHQRGVAVIMDMVLNHAYGTCPLVMMYWDSQNNRPAADNPWFNQECPHPPYCWGFDFNHESPDTKKFVDSVNAYWLTQYHVDGFRFDFTKGFTNNTNGGSYDADRIAILKRMADHIWSVNPKAYVILEHFCDNSEEKELADYGMMIWGNTNYNYAEATMGYNDNSDFSWISYKKRGWNNPNLVGYMESHDEERLMYKNLTWGNGSGDYSVKDLSTALRRMELAGNFFFTIPGPKMIWEFGERGFDLSINWPCGDESCRVDPKPPHWEYMQDWRRRTLYNTWKTLIELKNNYDVFKTDDFDLSVSGNTKRIKLHSADMDVVILGNFDVKTKTIDPGFYSTGTWYEFWSGDSLDVTNVNEEIQLAPGEYRMYTTKKLETPEFVGISENVDGTAKMLKVFPNPAQNEIHILTESDKSFAAVELKVLDLNGKVIVQKMYDNIVKGTNEFVLDVSNLEKGFYFVSLNNGKDRMVGKFVKQ
jgi:glycosidase